MTETGAEAGRQAPQAGALHHVEVWVPDLAGARRRWGWLLGELAYQPYQDWQFGTSYRLGDFYLVLEESPDLERGPYRRRRAGLNHLAFHLADRAQLDALVREAPRHGWRLLFAELHPFAGGPEHCAGYLEDDDGFEVELVVPRPAGADAEKPAE